MNLFKFQCFILFSEINTGRPGDPQYDTYGDEYYDRDRGRYDPRQPTGGRGRQQPGPNTYRPGPGQRDVRDDYRDYRGPPGQNPRDRRDPRDYRDGHIDDVRLRSGEYGRGRGGDYPRVFVALFDYDPPTMSPNPDACDEELGFREGQLIKVYGDKDTDGFYWGEAGARSGYVPCNMVSEVQVIIFFLSYNFHSVLSCLF